MPPRFNPNAYKSSGCSFNRFPGCKKERGTQQGAKRSSPSLSSSAPSIRPLTFRVTILRELTVLILMAVPVWSNSNHSHAAKEFQIRLTVKRLANFLSADKRAAGHNRNYGKNGNYATGRRPRFRYSKRAR